MIALLILALFTFVVLYTPRIDRRGFDGNEKIGRLLDGACTKDGRR